MATKAQKNAPAAAEQTTENETANAMDAAEATPAAEPNDVTEDNTVNAMDAAPAEPNDVTEDNQDEKKVVFFHPQDFLPDAEDLEDEEVEDNEWLKITFPNGEIYELEVGKVAVMLAKRGISLAEQEVTVTEAYVCSLVDNVLCWNDFGITGRTSNYDYSNNWLRAIKELI